nr:histidinol dehydrogenase [Corynebacterium glutamicum]
MLNVTDLRGQTPSKSDIRRALPRGGTDVWSVLPIVQPVVEDVQNRGAEAALDYGEKFDHIRPASVRVPAEVIAAAENTLDPLVRESIEESIRRVRKFTLSKSHPSTPLNFHQVAPSLSVSCRLIAWDCTFQAAMRVPIKRDYEYCPAQEAGVNSLVVASPPQAEHGGWPHPTILAACSILGVDEVWAVGGGQAVALLAYGDDAAGLEPVDMITGPGNIFVTAAKRLVRGVVGTDSEAGPTEIAVLADASANAVNVAYDLISQAEHDVMAASVLITDSEQLAKDVNREIEARYSITRNAERVAEALRGAQSGIVLVDDISVGIQVADQYAAEHLEIHTENARAVAEQITNAGAIFVGDFSPVPLGDYSAGSARFSAGLSTHTFLRPVNLIEYDEAALKDVSQVVINFANAEDLPAHGEAIRARFENLPTTDEA